MIIDLVLAWEAEGSGDRGQAQKYRVEGGQGIVEVYEKMGQPHGPGQEGLATFLKNTLTTIIAQGKGDPFGLMPGGLAMPGYRPAVEVRIVAEDEAAIAPEGACKAYKPRPNPYSLEAIAEDAPEDEEGRKWAYRGVICEFWATSLDDCAVCPNEACPAHCPHCGNPLVKEPLNEFLKEKMGAGPIVIATYGPNSPDDCHIFFNEYKSNLDRITEALKAQARDRACSHVDPAFYGHVIEGYEPLAARTCPRCQGTAVPVALKAQGAKGGPVWLLTWDCGKRHYDIKAPGAIAPWPFIEEYATAADLEAVGFRVIQ